MKSNLIKFYATLMMAFVSFFSVAQPVDPPADDDPAPAPINTYLIWLAIVGIGFVYYIIRTRKVISSK